MSYVESTVDLSADIIDVRDIIERVEELESSIQDYENEDGDLELHDEHVSQKEELEELRGVLSELAGYGGDEEFEGDWYPVHLVAESYFQEYAQNLAEECGMVDTNASWPMTCIDWEQAARELQTDYINILIHGSTYWYR